jgi:hypothetical protein
MVPGGDEKLFKSNEHFRLELSIDTDFSVSTLSRPNRDWGSRLSRLSILSILIKKTIFHFQIYPKFFSQLQLQGITSSVAVLYLY